MNKTLVYGGFILIAIIAAFSYLGSQPGKYDDFASCISEKGAKMYGAWWCPHCQEQKKEFGRSWKVLVNNGGYVECSTAEKITIELCEKENITGFPTWRFADGSELGGKVSFQALSAKTGCELPK